MLTAAVIFVARANLGRVSEKGTMGINWDWSWSSHLPQVSDMAW
jgi:hypothetical protein